MRRIVNVLTGVVAALCVAAFLVWGEWAVLGVVGAAVGVLAWQVAAASKPRPPRGAEAGVAPTTPSGRIGHQRDRDVVRRERRQGEGVEHLVETEPHR
ncbi:hypothetical protein GCM10018773_22010 [Streptomyces candidus]|nr:hypothetical protein GCM10018773_22010 [Streptomyces candidus]